jgi:hypothetical protein
LNAMLSKLCIALTSFIWEHICFYAFDAHMSLV